MSLSPEQLDAIRRRYPFFYTGPARGDVGNLLAEVDELRAKLATRPAPTIESRVRVIDSTQKSLVGRTGVVKAIHPERDACVVDVLMDPVDGAEWHFWTVLEKLEVV